MLAAVRRNPFVLPVLVLALALTTWAWQADADDSPPSSIVTIDPARIVDTRDGTDLGIAGPVANGVSQRVQVTGLVPTTTGERTVVPSGATGVLLNVTAVRPSARGFLAIRPGTASGEPATSNLNFTAGNNIPNAVTVALPTSGDDAGVIDLWHGGPDASSQLEVLIDVVGYVVAAESASSVELAGASQGTEVIDTELSDEQRDKVFVSLVFDAPSSGQLLVTGSILVSDMEANAFITCGISTDGSNPSTGAWESAGSDGSIGQIAITELLEIPAGAATVQLVCSSFRADDGNPAILNNGRLTATFSAS